MNRASKSRVRVTRVRKEMELISRWRVQMPSALNSARRGSAGDLFYVCRSTFRACNVVPRSCAAVDRLPQPKHTTGSSVAHFGEVWQNANRGEAVGSPRPSCGSGARCGLGPSTPQHAIPQQLQSAVPQQQTCAAKGVPTVVSAVAAEAISAGDSVAVIKLKISPVTSADRVVRVICGISHIITHIPTSGQGWHCFPRSDRMWQTASSH